ncbi:zinc finger protein piragua-like [Battus philenor]|uniref:zinc finger protein piragua-like n=1 Tax=Battus philenor TaxID=42288 RepID=UPI0035D10A65
MDSCRVCLNKNVNMCSLFGPGDIIDRIYFCTGIKIVKQDGLSTKICNVCLDNLSIAHKFKTLCLQAENTLQNLIEEIKEEMIPPNEAEDVISISKNDLDSKEEASDFSDPVKTELQENLDTEIIRKSNRVRLKVKKESIKEMEIQPKVHKKRGPYNKTGIPKRLRKFKFRKLYCEPCDLKFTSKQQSDEHKKDTHKGSDSFVCEICGKVFVHRASHYTHVRSHLPPRHACDHCDYRTWHKHDLVKHIRIHTGVKMYQCEYCTASYYTSSNLACHIRRYHERERRHHCHLCERSFYDRTKLNRHLDSHNEIKRFECDVCHACFTRRCYWKKHLQRQHNVTVPPQRPGRQKTNRQVGEVDAAVSKIEAVM